MKDNIAISIITVNSNQPYIDILSKHHKLSEICYILIENESQDTNISFT